MKLLGHAFKIIRAYGPSAILLLILFGLWETGSKVDLIPHFIAPPPTEIIEVLYTKAGSFWNHFYATFLEVLYGYTLGLIVGLILGIAIAYSSLTNRTLYPLIVVSQTIPIIAMGPVLVLIFGFGPASKVFMVAVVVFFPITMNTADGLKSVDPELLRFLRSLGASEWAMFWKIKFPSALPTIFTAIKIAATYGVIAAVVGEMVGAQFGLGALLIRSHRMMMPASLFGSVALMAVLGISWFLAAVAAERLIIPWHFARVSRK
ncbi:MAG: ABC transporter permease [Deltaproteobacteria bacterium]|nr:ABC transporter permease [Deltaproteobacteria bacterium]